MFVSDEAYKELSGADIAIPYREGTDSKLYPLPPSVQEYIGFHNAAGKDLLVLVRNYLHIYLLSRRNRINSNRYGEVHDSVARSL